MKTFWQKLNKKNKPFFCLAPMADVTDIAFRQIIARYGKPDVFWTEFVSSDGLASIGREVLKNDLFFLKNERPIIAQLFGSDVEKMRIAVKYVCSLGFDGIDINMGCPDKTILKQGSGSALILDKQKAGDIIQAVSDGIKDSKKKNISISVKTRVGYNKSQINEWIPFLLSFNLDALTIHARTTKEMSKVPANWDYIKQVVEIRNKLGVKTKIIGNGDVKNIKEGYTLAKITGCDGIMIGRGIFGNPWLFKNLNKIKINSKILDIFTPTIKQRLKALLEHTELFDKFLGKYKNFSIMKKHYKAYVNDFIGAKELRMKLMETKNVNEVSVIIKEFLKNN